MAKRKQRAGGIIAVRRGTQGPFSPALLRNKPRILPGPLPKGFLTEKRNPRCAVLSRAGGFVLYGIDEEAVVTVAHLGGVRLQAGSSPLGSAP